MTGPGVVTLPIVAQSAGWFPTLLGFGIVGILSTLSSLFICEAMTEVPGNEFFQSNVEFSNLILCFFGHRYHLLVQIICFLAMQTTNIASIAISAQLFDNLLIQVFHRTCGIQVHPTAALICVSKQLDSASPFTGVMIMTTGVVLAFALILPLGLLKLSENIWVQLVSFVLILLIVLQWIVTFITHGLDTSLVPAVGSDISQTFGTILFNYAFITTVPSWANAKQPNVSIHKTVGWGVGITTTIYVAVAILGGMAYHIPNNSSLIQAINSSPDVTVLSQITGYTFPLAALITSIPINIIVIRYNLIQSGACNLAWANILAGILPWFVAIPCMTGSGLTTVINWSSLFLVSTANFIIPFVLYIYSKRHRERLSKLPIIEMEQHRRLSREMSRSSFSAYPGRNTSVSGSIHRRLTGSSLHLRAPSHPELSVDPAMGGTATVMVNPVAGGMAGGSLIQDTVMEEDSISEPEGSESRSHSQYRIQDFDGGALGHNASEMEQVANGPYFSYSRDGERHEREPSTGYSADASDSRIQSSPSAQRPSGVSAVILHDPVTEMAQRKTLPRRVSHRDRLLSMLSDKHRRAMEEQAKKMEEEQNEKSRPPMILLSQSTAPEATDDDHYSLSDKGLYHMNNGSYGSDHCGEKDDAAQRMDIAEANTSLSAAIKKSNRQSSAAHMFSHHGSTLNLPPLSPSPRINTPTLELSGTEDTGPETPCQDPVDTSSVQCIPSSLEADKSMVDLNRLGPGSVSHLSLSPGSSTSDRPMERHVSFTHELPLPLAPPPELDRRPSFTEETRRAVKAAVAGLKGASPSRSRANPSPGHSPSRSARDTHADSQEWKRTLLEDSREQMDESNEEEEDGDGQETMGPKLMISNMDQQRGRSATANLKSNEVRRDSVGRIAATFVSQPGSFSIKTGPLNLSYSQSQDSADQQRLHIPRWLNTHLVHLDGPLSPSAPPVLVLDEAPAAASRNHTRAVSASATLQERNDISASKRATRSQSAQSFQDKVQQDHLAVPQSAHSPSVHLTPPSPFLNHRTLSQDSSFNWRSPDGKNVNAEPASSSRELLHRASIGARSSLRLSGSGKALAAPFQSGNNYSIPGFGSGSHDRRSLSSPGHSPQQILPPSPGQPIQDWFTRHRRYSRDPSRSPSTCVGVGPLSAVGSVPMGPPSPQPSMQSTTTGRGTVQHAENNDVASHERPMTPHTTALAPVTAAAAAQGVPNMIGYGQDRHRASSSWQAYQGQLHQLQPSASAFALEDGLAHESLWSLRAIPSWIPVSGLRVAWISLVVLAVAISATIIYDFVQLGLGKNVMS
ncbi:hypothetical protein EDD11_004963 [Mortierella claussenii]|nr:hypothetical protein EDD11_004963 [Mortierella claussenii]